MRQFKSCLSLLLGEEASPSIGNTLWHVHDVHVSGYNSAGSVRIRMKFGILRVYCLELALTYFGRDPRRSESGRASGNFVFFCPVNNARRCRFLVSQISRNLHTRYGSMLPWILSENIFENLLIRGHFSKKANFGQPSSTTSDFRPRYLGNDYKSRKVMTGWPAYRMLAFHLYPWNQLKVIPLACRLRTRNDIPGHSRLFCLALQT